jgi:cell wall-associated NlpC family hydrolase
MRRTHIWVVTLAAALLLATPPGLAAAEPSNPESVAQLIAAVANANQKLQDVVQTQQESVNKAIVDVATARENAEAANADVDNSQQAVKDANAAIAAAQDRFDDFAAATYVNGPSGSYLSATNPEEMIATATAGHTVSASAEQVMTDLKRARTEQVNKESAARAAQQKADQAVADAQRSQDNAVAALTDAQHQFGSQQAEIDRLVAERNAAQGRLDTASATVTKTAATTGDRWDRAPGGPAPASANMQWDSAWDPTLPAVPSAFVSGDPIAIINTVMGYATTSAQATQNMGRQFLQKLGLAPTPTGYTNNGAIPRVYGQQASEYVIARALSQRGVPYSWGGGNAAGPSNGIDDGAGTVGFDCSGLILYAFAGVGIKLPHYSGSQYDAGRKIPSSQMRRGDVIFYGPGGSQHVTIYLGNGQMLEAPYTGSVVKVSPVRTSGMTPYVVRFIEY